MVCVGRVGMSMQATYRLWRRGAGELDVGTATALREWKAQENSTLALPPHYASGRPAGRTRPDIVGVACWVGLCW